MNKSKYHYYSFAVILGNEDSHILPHPRKKDLDYIIDRLRDVADQFEKEKNKKGKLPKQI